jgi:succinyl-diaminopimelate desuccinylase
MPDRRTRLWKTILSLGWSEGDFLFGRGVVDNHQRACQLVLWRSRCADQKAKRPTLSALFWSPMKKAAMVFGHDLHHDASRRICSRKDLFSCRFTRGGRERKSEFPKKGVLWLKVTINGQQCHASMPDKGVNALRAGAAMIVRLEGLKERFPASDPLFSPPVSTFEPTKKEANVENINTLPGRDVFYLDCRVLPCYPLDDVLAAIKAIGAEIEKERGVSVSYDIVQKTNAAPPTAPDSEIVERLQKALREELGREARLTGIGGGTFAALLRRKGFPAAVWSTLLGMAHQPNEKALALATLQDARLMARALFG